LSEKHIDVVTKLANLLNKEEISWAIGGSLLLSINGIDTSVRDIDIVVDEKDMESLKNLMKNSGFNYVIKGPKPPSNSSMLLSIELDGIEVEFLVGFKVGKYQYPNGKKLVSETINKDGIDINLCHMEHWLIVYEELNRQEKIKLIKEKTRLL